MSLAHSDPITVKGLVDSGASGSGYIDRTFVKAHNIPTEPTPSARPLLLGNGEAADTVTEYVLIHTTIGIHSELALLYVAKVESPVIFGLRWLQRHNPYINWEDMTLTFGSGYCRSRCLPPGTPFPPRAPVIRDPPRTSVSSPQTRNTTYRQPYVEDVPDHAPDEEALSTTTYRQPYVEDVPDHTLDEEALSTDSSIDMTFDQTLTPGGDHYRT